VTAILVAGASRGIGAATAVAFASDGAEQVAILGRSERELGAVADEIRSRGATALPIVCDLTDPSQRRAAAECVGPVDVFVYAAGTNVPQRFLDVSEETYDRVFEVNVRSGYFLAQDVARGMVEAGGGTSIVFISSQMGHVGGLDRTVYCATKHAVEGLVKALALELAPHGIRVVSIAPTFVRTAMTAAQLDDPAVGPSLLEQIPLGRFADAADVAAAVTWVASPRAPMITGTSIRVDGGWTAR
jgi:NAD(P)-dependent dehydrogenase (short-subunit alcohol dehydrogenase family)